MKQIIQVKVKINPAFPWEAIRPITIAVDEGTDVDKACLLLAKYLFESGEPIVGIRWNYAESTQGHYVIL